MAGEYIQAGSIQEYWKNLKAYFQCSKPFFPGNHQTGI
jgi:acyl transferase domain-containing protein